MSFGFMPYAIALLVIILVALFTSFLAWKYHQEASRSATESEALRLAIAALTRVVSLQEAVDQILEQLASLVPFETGSVFFLQDQQWKLISGYGFADYDNVRDLRLDHIETLPISQVYQNQEQLILPEAQKHPAFQAPYAGHIQSWMGIPIHYQDNVIGVLSLDSGQADFFTTDHARLATLFANHAALAIENSRLFETTRRSAQESETLRQASAALVADLSEQAVMERVLEQLRRLAPYESASIGLIHGNRLEIVAAAGFVNNQDILGTVVDLEKEDSPAVEVVQLRQAVVISDTKEYASFKHPPHDRIKSWLGLPLIYRQQIIGLLSLDSEQTGFFTDQHAHRAVIFADQVALALENARLFERMRQMAITDSLTQLNNRRQFFDLVKIEFERSLRYEHELVIIMLDLDHFKKVNDTWGHQVGDEVLQQVAMLCKQSLRVMDIIGRYGGEEFVIAMPETNREAAAQTAERLRQTIADSPIDTRAGSLRITASLGAALADKNLTSLDVLLSNADEALYHAKRQGRNRVCFIDETGSEQ